MPLQPDSVSTGVTFLGCLSTAFIHLVVFPDVLLQQYLVNCLSILSETYGEYSLAPTDDLFRFWINVDAGALKSI